MKRKGFYQPTVEDAIEIGGIETLHPKLIPPVNTLIIKVAENFYLTI